MRVRNSGSMPLKDLPSGASFAITAGQKRLLTQADWAARLDTPDWQVLDRVQTDGPDLRLPELGLAQNTGRGAPTAVSRGSGPARFRRRDPHREDDVRGAAARWARIPGVGGELRLGLTGRGHDALDTLTEMVQQPGCPNSCTGRLHGLARARSWNLRKGAQGDRAARGHANSASLRERRGSVLTPDMEEVVSRISGRAGFAREQGREACRGTSSAPNVTARMAKDAWTASPRCPANG